MVNPSDANPDKDQHAKDNFLYPTSRYHGDFSPQNLAFNANLQEFAQRIGYICALETSGKMPPQEAYDQIKSLWKQLKKSRELLLTDDGTPDTPPPN
ncbi:hypothetical protein L3556_14470 [Candidatus Synechococcus calcipolaris G9]|uniref:Isopropylmalate/homocitrate/citramalate synthase n=1 Tax=Candidatus Synechococcus calcipolaris G9 TaxID=1497997 RepID=A0ABT6F2N5_9SYNE|nr:hypothetical protein [Candidatus Synechococcus calcipolaris]MDG2992124.1 hypothetical protein [Candidatus Synechococcus calcipolaris G9]